MKLPDSRRRFVNDTLGAKTLTNSSSPRLVLNSIKLSILALFLFFFQNANATHVVGGGITYAHIEGSNYLLTVRLYRDCSPGTYGLPGSVDLDVRWGNGTIPPTPTYNLPLVTNDTISPDIPPCVFDPGICVEEAIYEGVVSLPEGPSGFHMWFTICCRNATILNIVDPLAARETFYAYLPDVMVHGVNSSPVFNNMPPVYVCAGEDLDLDFSAYDMDGDSLDYYFYTPFDGVNGTGITFGPGIPPNNINISEVTWQPGFGATDPLDAAPGLLPGLTISPAGIISGVPTAPGQYVVGVMVDEYRDGELIGRISRDFQFNVLDCPPPLEAAIDVPDVCNGLTVDFSNLTTGIFTESWWDFGTGDPADSSVVFEPTFTYAAPGTYTVTLIVEKGTDCADTVEYTFDILDEIDMIVTPDSVSCNTGADGSAVVTPDDGSLTYLWSTAEVGYTIDGLTTGSYWVEGTNALGCLDTVYFVIDEPDVLDIAWNLTQPSCAGETDGVIEAIGLGGTAPYTYEWTAPAAMGPILTDVGAGTYEVTVTDANGCTATFTVVLDEPEEVMINVVNVDDVTCYGGNDGSIEIEIIGGTPPYVIDWLTLPESGLILNDLPAGDYPVEVTDANGCQAILLITVNEPPVFEVDLVILAEESCSSMNGELEAVVTGGVGSLTYDWDPDVSSTNIATGLAAGIYGVVVTDEDGCQAGAAVMLPDNMTGTVGIDDITPVSCEGGADGSITVSMTGGSPDFTYNWSCACSSTNVATGLSAGDYWLEVVDDNGCIDSLYFTIDELPALELVEVDVVSPNCHGDENGSATVEASGGTPGYSFEWSTEPVQYTATASSVPAGTYTVIVTDANGCQQVLPVSITEPDMLIANTEVLSNILCYGDSAGIATVSAEGGVGPYTYYWNELFVATDTVYDLPAGFYTVTATDANGCTADSSVKIIEYEDVMAEIIYDSVICPGELAEFIVLTNDIHGLYDYNWYVDGTYAWTGPSYSHTITGPTEISIALYSDAGCDPIFDTVMIQPLVIDPANLILTGTMDSICLGDAATLQAQVLDMTYVTDLYWNVEELLGLGPHTVYPNGSFVYEITMVNVCGEEYTVSHPINVHMPPEVWMNSSGLQDCDSVQVSFGFEYEDGDYPLIESVWTILGDEMTGPYADVTFYSSGSITADLELTFANGCTFDYDDLFGITVFESPDADFYFNPDPAVVFEVTEFVDISKGNPEYWEWYFEGALISNEERPTWVFEELGEYTVTEIITDENGCSDTAVHTVEVIGDFTVYVPNAFTPDGNGVNNTFKPIMTNIIDEGYEFLVFNRWGEVIFQTQDREEAWDGTYLGDAVQDDVYVWKLLVRDEQSQRHEYQGHVAVLR